MKDLKYEALKEALYAQDERVDELEEALHQIHQWAKAYPLDVFPEPDFKKAREVLEAAGMTLDAISASNMRHVITQVEKICADVLREEE